MGPYFTEIRTNLSRTMTGDRGSFDPLAFWEERLQHFDLSAVGYAGLALRYNRWLYRVRSFVFRRTLRRASLNVDSAKVLDVGSGTGFYINEWLRAGANDVIGSDLTGVATGGLEKRFHSSSSSSSTSRLNRHSRPVRST
jgi:SAM-dependent methyltransferase